MQNNYVDGNEIVTDHFHEYIYILICDELLFILWQCMMHANNKPVFAMPYGNFARRKPSFA